MSKMMKIILAALMLASCGGAQASFTLTIATACPYGAALPDGCPAASAGTIQIPHLLDVAQVTALNILPGSGYTNGTYTWTTTGGGGSGATGSVTVSGGALGGVSGTSYTIANQGSGYTSRPTIVYSAGAGTGGSITPTVYQATPHNAATTWNMPGVDYPVGIPSGTTLQDPTTASLPAGASYSAGTVTITGCGVTLNGYDFTLHNTLLVVNVSSAGCTTTVENSKQQGFNTLYPIANLSKLGAGGTFVYQNNEYDGKNNYGISPYGGSGWNVNNPVNDAYTGEAHTVAFYYNYLHNFDAKIIQMSGAASGYDSLIEKYNVFSNMGSCIGCSHGEAEYTYSGGGTTVQYTVQFNTYLQQFFYGTAGTDNITAPHAVQADNMAITAVADDHNVFFVQGPQGTCASNGTAYQSAASVYDGAQNDPGAASLTGAVFQYNYIDNSGAYLPWYHNASGGATLSETVTNNVDAGAGGACN